MAEGCSATSWKQFANPIMVCYVMGASLAGTMQPHLFQDIM